MGALGDTYVTVDELKRYLRMDMTETVFDLTLESAIDSASREVEDFCGRQFNRSEIATPRQYRSASRSRSSTMSRSLDVDDFWDVTSFALNGVGYTDQALDLYPLNGVVDGTPGWPFYRISSRTSYFYDSIFTVTAKWGWQSVPAPVKQATLIVAAQNYRLADAPLGVTGMGGEFGGVVRVRDIPQARSKLNRYVARPLLVG